MSADSLELSSGESLPIGIVVRAGHGRAPAVIRATGLPLSRESRLLVDWEMRAPEHPGIYAVGSAIDLLGDELRGERGARDAARQGEVAAENVFAEILVGLGETSERRQFATQSSDVVVAIGPGETAGMLKGVPVTGWRAQLARQAAELAYFEAIGGPGGLLGAIGERVRPTRLLGI
jgi:NADH dehydrogenase FAD-containing subunit